MLQIFSSVIILLQHIVEYVLLCIIQLNIMNFIKDIKLSYLRNLSKYQSIETVFYLQWQI